MKNTVSFQRKGISIAMKCFTSIFYFFLFSLSSLAACVDKEPVDEEDVDPAINPPITFVEDDEEGNNEGITGPAFPSFTSNNAPAFLVQWDMEETLMVPVEVTLNLFML